MKKIVLALTLLLAACSSNNSPSVSSQDNQNDSGFIYEVSKITVGSVEVSGTSTLTFPETNATVTDATVVVTMKNSTAAPIPFAASLVDSTGYLIKLNRCAASIPAKSSCQITLSFSSRSLYTGVYPGSLKVTSGTSEDFVQLSAEVKNKIDPETGGTPNLQMALNLPFNPLGSSAVRTLTIKNIGNGTAHGVVATLDPNYIIQVNRCSSNLKPNASCTIQIMYKNYRTNPVAPAAPISIAATGIPAQSLDLKSGLPPVTSFHTPGFKLLTDVKSTSSGSSVQGCGLTVNNPSDGQPITVGVYGQPNGSLELITDSESCTLWAPMEMPNSPFTFVYATQNGENFCLSTATNYYAIKIPDDIFNQWSTGACYELMSSADWNSFAIQDIGAGIDPHEDALNPYTIIGFGQSLYIYTYGAKLYKVDLLSDDRLYNPLTSYTNISSLFGTGPDVEVYEPFVVKNHLFVRSASNASNQQSKYYRLDNNVAVPINFDCESAGCFSIGQEYIAPNGDLYVVLMENMQQTNWVYKTTDGINFTKLFQTQASYHAINNSAVSAGGYIYYRGDNSEVYRFKNSAPSSIEDTHMQSTMLINLDDSRVMLAEYNSNKIYVTNSQGELDLLTTTPTKMTDVVKGNDLLYFTSNLDDQHLDLYTFVPSTNAFNRIVQDYTGAKTNDLSCLSGIYPVAVVNALNNNLLVSCPNSDDGHYHVKIRAFTPTGVETQIPNVQLYEGASFFGHFPQLNGGYFQTKTSFAYKTKFYISGALGSQTGGLLTFDSNNNPSYINPMTNNGQGYGGYSLTLYNDEIFFGGNTGSGEIPSGSTDNFELLKYYAP